MIEGSVFSMRQLLDSTCDDRELAGQIAEAFVADTPLQLESLESAIGRNDIKTAERVAHTIKGIRRDRRRRELAQRRLRM